MRGNASLLRRIIQYTRPYGFWLFVRIAGAAVNAALDIFLAYTVIRLVDLSLAGKRDELFNTIYVLSAAIAAGIFFIMLSRYASGRISTYAGRDIRRDITGHIGKLPVSVIENRHTGDTISALTNDTAIVQAFLDEVLPELVFQPLRLAGAIGFMLFVNWKLLLFSIFILPAAVLLANLISKPMGRYFEELQQSLGRLNSIVLDIIGGIYVIKAFNLKNIFYKKYRKEVREILKKSLSIEKRSSLLTPANIIIQIFPFILCILYGGYLSVRGQLSPGELLAFIQMMNYLVEPAQSVPGLISSSRAAMGAAGHLFSILDEQAEAQSGKSFSITGSECPVEFENAVFSYNHENRILDDVSLCLTPGKITALVGPSGSGKSTIVKLICGFYRLDSGRLKLFGHDMEEWNPEEARRNIAVVSQDTWLFPVSIAENISYGRPGATMDEIVEAAKRANAHDFITELPEGYNTLAGEGGARLSGGQRQKLAIARAMLKEAPLLILDEPASALDAMSEAAVREVLEHYAKNRTVLIIAHRLSSIKIADEIVVLNEGKISAKGTHERLMSENGLYRKLYAKQFAGMEPACGIPEEDAV